MNLMKYSNGLGHLIMSLACTVVGVALMLAPGTDATTKGIGASLVMTVQGYWFVSGSAKQIATEVVSQLPGASQAVVSVSSVPVLTTQAGPLPAASNPPA